MEKKFVCPKCKTPSDLRFDIENGYCVRCRKFTGRRGGAFPHIVLGAIHLEVGIPCPVCRTRFAVGDTITVRFLRSTASLRPAYVHARCLRTPLLSRRNG